MAKMLWKPSKERAAETNMRRFIDFANERHGSGFADYAELYKWSVDDRASFWAAVWDFCEVIASSAYRKVVRDEDAMPGSKWFTGSRMNYAENLLRFRDDHPAIVFKGEESEPVRLTYAELYDRVSVTAKALRKSGVHPGDRVAGFMPNIPEAIIAMLAATSIGAIWSSCSPDFGIKGVLDRFGQIEPKVLFTANGYSYNGKKFDSLERISGILEHLPSIKKVIVVGYTEERADISGVRDALHYQDFVEGERPGSIDFEQTPFDHPLYIMYSSGTTGVPKCIVHGAGGTLLQHLKELAIHTDLKREDKIFYFTTCGWMMWNWLVSSLAVGATVLLFDGNPFYPDPGVLWKFAEDEGMTIFGTSAKYLAAIEKEGLKPGRDYDLSALKGICSTGSPLSVESFEYVYREIKEDVNLASIAGGTDIISCFVLGNPIGPVYAGEIQCRGLGMDVRCWDEAGNDLVGVRGELVCAKSFPSMPIYFWNDPDGKKYHEAYFDVYPNVWRHGDYIILSETGGIVMLGRSDTTLNPGGVRIGTSEIYRQVEAFDQVVDSLVIGQQWEDDERVLLFLKMREGEELTDGLLGEIRSAIRRNASPRHVPAKILAVADIPYTISGKKVEKAVKQVIHGEEVLNRDALANPAALDLYAGLAELED